jgi:hypothetical protein
MLHHSQLSPHFSRQKSLSHAPVNANAAAQDNIESLFLEFFTTLAAINERTTVDEVCHLVMLLTVQVEISCMGAASAGCLGFADSQQRPEKFVHRAAKSCQEESVQRARSRQEATPLSPQSLYERGLCPSSSSCLAQRIQNSPSPSAQRVGVYAPRR